MELAVAMPQSSWKWTATGTERRLTTSLTSARLPEENAAVGIAQANDVRPAPHSCAQRLPQNPDHPSSRQRSAPRQKSLPGHGLSKTGSSLRSSGNFPHKMFPAPGPHGISSTCQTHSKQASGQPAPPPGFGPPLERYFSCGCCQRRQGVHFLRKWPVPLEKLRVLWIGARVASLYILNAHLVQQAHRLEFIL